MTIKWTQQIIGKKNRLLVFVVFSAGIALICFFLALQLEPWFYAINTRVRFHMEAPAETKVNICWDQAQIECLPLVPYLETENRIAETGEVADVWLSELPPRPIYYVSIIFRSEVHHAIIYELELDSSNVLLWGYLPGIGIRNLRVDADQFAPRGISPKLLNGVYNFDGDSGSQLNLIQEIKPGPSGSSTLTKLRIWGYLFSIYLLLAIPLYLLPYMVQNLGVAIKNDHLPYYPWWVFLLCSTAVISMLFLVGNSATIITQFDPMGYLHLATGKGWFNEARLPGYPLFLWIALKLSGYSLNGVVLLQAILLALSAIICVLILKKWLHPIAAVVFIFLVLFSPAQIHWAHWILRESLFTSLVLLAMATVIAHFTSQRKMLSDIWLVIFSLLCGVAFLVRENGILLPVAMLPVLLPKIVKHLFFSSAIIRQRIQTIFLLITRHALPVLSIGILYIGFGIYNYSHYGYFQIGVHQTSHHFLVRTIYPSNFDSRSLIRSTFSMSKEARSYLGRPLYRSFILAREQNPKLDPIYVAIFPFINQQRSENGQPYNPFHSASVLDEIGKNANNLVPWESAYVGVLRQYRELLSLDTSGYFVITDDSATVAYKKGLLSELSQDIKYEGKIIKSDSIFARYYEFSQEYSWYGFLFIFALLSSVYILRYDDPVFLTPIAFFVANGFLLLVTRLVNVRYVVSLDVLLILQMILGLNCWLYRHSSIILHKISSE